jgi:putative transposase
LGGAETDEGITTFGCPENVHSQQGADGPVADICREAGVSHDGLLPTEMRRLKQLEDENSKLRKVVADLSLDKEMCRTRSAESFEACPEAQAG